ncbi:unnamed protein product [Acanthoscelides obtectus]|uniref:Uncharacterized protein n=1 Tax=Acanthoscelides obtectus TaxID=200917 RepID=A0A9P0PH00_ACAOB|nr:unnamed protein product [Acanthoscelides obtectus]CAK1661196.1 hypothetical protein AOBTE_LOCUS22508 [Acanthoscelides obtectus]
MIAFLVGAVGVDNCCCEEIKDLKATAMQLGVLPPAEGEGGRPPCICPKDEASAPPAQKEAAGALRAESQNKCCCAEKSVEEEKNKSTSAGGPCDCGHSQNEDRPCGCGSNLEPPEPPVKLCACPPGVDEKEKLAEELAEKVDKAEAEIQQLRAELQKLQYFQAAAKTPAAAMYKEIMKDTYEGKCNPKKKPVLAPPTKTKRPGDQTGLMTGSSGPAARSNSRSVIKTPPPTPVAVNLPPIVTSYSRSVYRTVTPANEEGCAPTCPATTSIPKMEAHPRKRMPPCLSKTGSRRGSLSRQGQVAPRSSTPSTMQNQGISHAILQNLPGNVTICTPSGSPADDSGPTDCEIYGCTDTEEPEPAEEYCTDYNCDNEACTLRPKEEKEEDGDEEKESKTTEPSSKASSKASVASKSPSRASKTSAGSKIDEEKGAKKGEEEAPTEEAEG